MQGFKRFIGLSLMLSLLGAAACTQHLAQSPDVAGNIRKSLDQAGLQAVAVSQDRAQGIVTLKGIVPSNFEKSQAGIIANLACAGQVVSNQLVVVPPGTGNEEQTIDAEVNKDVEKSLDTTLLQNKLQVKDQKMTSSD